MSDKAIAKAIRDLNGAVERLSQNTGLTEKAVIILLSHCTPQRTIRQVLDGITEAMEKYVLDEEGSDG